VLVPPAGFLRAAREICSQQGILLIADEVQTGLGRTGRRFACDHEGVRPDIYVLGKALGGGIFPVSAVVGGEDVVGVLRPGEHGSTFGGNPLACALAREVLRLLADGRLAARAAELGDAMGDRLRRASLPAVSAIRQVGLWIGVDVDPAFATGYAVCAQLLERGVLCKDTHEQTVRFAPPLIVEDAELDWALSQVEAVLGGLGTIPPMV
jgi:ornithine--oxo-acid transaminase